MDAARKILDIKCKQDLKFLNTIYTKGADQSINTEVRNSMDKIMSSGFNRIVLVEEDITRLEPLDNELNTMLYLFNKNKEAGKDLGEGIFELHKENIEYIKYVNP